MCLGVQGDSEGRRPWDFWDLPKGELYVYNFLENNCKSNNNERLLFTMWEALF